MIVGRNIGVRFGNAPILDNVDAAVRPGEVLAVLGPNGAGKSTLLKVLAGLLTPSAGKVTLDGRALNAFGAKELARRRAVLSQATPISFPFSVTEVVTIGRTPYIGRTESLHDRDVVETVLRRMDAYHLKDRLYASLSGGEQQKVQFARVLAQVWDQPQACLFLDEPTAALDLKQQMSIAGLARDLAAERGFAVLTIVHDLVLARQFADRSLFLKDGRVACTGRIDEIMNADTIAGVYGIPQKIAANYL